MQVSSYQILLALQLTWKHNEEIKWFMIMHVTRRREELVVMGGGGVPHQKPRGPMTVATHVATPQ